MWRSSDLVATVEPEPELNVFIQLQAHAWFLHTLIFTTDHTHTTHINMFSWGIFLHLCIFNRVYTTICHLHSISQMLLVSAQHNEEPALSVFIYFADYIINTHTHHNAVLIALNSSVKRSGEIRVNHQTNQTASPWEAIWVVVRMWGRPIWHISKLPQVQLSVCHAGIWAPSPPDKLFTEFTATPIIETSGSSQRGLALQLQTKRFSRAREYCARICLCRVCSSRSIQGIRLHK